MKKWTLLLLLSLLGCGDHTPSIPEAKPHLTKKQKVAQVAKAIWGNEYTGQGGALLVTPPTYTNPAEQYAQSLGYLTTPPTPPSTNCTEGQVDPDGDPDDNDCTGDPNE